MVGILVSFWDGPFSGAMLVSGRVELVIIVQSPVGSLAANILAEATRDRILGERWAPNTGGLKVEKWRSGGLFICLFIYLFTYF